MPALPQHCPRPRELDDLELLVSGAFSPLSRFGEHPLVTLELPDEVRAAAEAAGGVELVDPEGLPLARVTLPGGAIEALGRPAYGPFRRLRLTPAESRERYAGRTVVPVTGPLTRTDLARIGTRPVVLLALVGEGTPQEAAGLSPVTLLRATLAAAALLPDAAVVAVPLAAHGDAEADHALGVTVVEAYAGGAPVLALPGPSAPAVGGTGELPDEVAAVLDGAEQQRRGLVLFFTGLSGSGKSTLARALMDRILEQGRTLTSLDGDVVRRHLSAGLTFSREDRETNIRRIGWVAAEIARHGGLAVCSPIAPFAATRAQVRELVEDAEADFFLIHVATPLEECERRDRKGLYAKARAGEIPEFTGISSPYEEPDDADVRVDTTGRSIDDALEDVVAALRDAGLLDLPPVAPEAEAAPVSQPRRAASTAAPFSVLFVCTANICRSPSMELLATSLAGPDAGLEFASAGTQGFVDEPVDGDVAATLVARGVSVSGFRSRPLTRELVAQADLVLTASANQRAAILQETPALFRKVFSLGQFVATAETLDATPPDRAALLAAVATRIGRAEPADLPDPFNRGAEAAEASTARIEELIRGLLRVLGG
ncbi:adenylyl-sulfate kinase [Nocardioides sp. TRM66260-LWL]|uniref:adenylyl-sulfate kinase n=1 Tax=Nocardioides sp. TRM66260-LWL TaxID=2874478 RepID=UPI001CC76235|nr:adenylyl-sulfate kinase [Nocardioides sp. TRM66260-LWL]MBZ5734939.1 adenylyl-sulfate kinase [Nocardioides sp. TRM66260-LWL]